MSGLAGIICFRAGLNPVVYFARPYGRLHPFLFDGVTYVRRSERPFVARSRGPAIPS